MYVAVANIFTVRNLVDKKAGAIEARRFASDSWFFTAFCRNRDLFLCLMDGRLRITSIYGLVFLHDHRYLLGSYRRGCEGRPRNS